MQSPHTRWTVHFKKAEFLWAAREKKWIIIRIVDEKEETPDQDDDIIARFLEF